MDKIREELVHFNTAKIATEKGFNLSCDWSVDKDNNKHFGVDMFYPNNSEYTYNPQEDPEVIKHEEFLSGLYNNPTQSLLQRWLREVHSIEIKIEYPDGFWKYIAYTNLSPTPLKNGGIGFKTYELALEEALREGCKTLVTILTNPIK